jgi:uncharacterized protein DUF1003
MPHRYSNVARWNEGDVAHAAIGCFATNGVPSSPKQPAPLPSGLPWLCFHQAAGRIQQPERGSHRPRHAQQPAHQRVTSVAGAAAPSTSALHSRLRAQLDRARATSALWPGRNPASLRVHTATIDGDASAGAAKSSRWRHPTNRHLDQRRRGERIADRVTAIVGSRRFIVVRTAIVTAWIALNLLAVAYRWDPYPFILLNPVFSTQAAYAAPLILLSQNRQADTDRITAEHDYRVNQLALQHLIAWHRDTHGPDCPCVRQVGATAEGLLTELSRDL